MFSFLIFGLLASVVVRILASLVLARFAHPPAWVRWLYEVSWGATLLFALVAVFLISIVIAAIIAVVAAVCLLVLGAELRRNASPMGRRNRRGSSSG